MPVVIARAPLDQKDKPQAINHYRRDFIATVPSKRGRHG